MNDFNKQYIRAGVAKRDITTENSGARIKDRLYARALVLDNGSELTAIITMDTTAIGGRAISDDMLPDVGENFLPELHRRLKSQLNIASSNVLVNASHTHPAGEMLCDDLAQIERVYDAVRRAAENMVPVKIGCGSGQEAEIAMNRTVTLNNSQHWTIRHTNPSPRKADIASYGPVDSEITILRLDRLDGTPLAVVYNFAVHLLWADIENSISGNIPAYATQVIEQDLGKGAMALFIQGAAGDINDIEYKDFTKVRDIVPLGKKLGRSVLVAYHKIKPSKQVELKVISDYIRLPRRTDIKMKVSQLEATQQQLLESLHGLTLNFETFLQLEPNQLASDTKMAEFNRRNITKYRQNIDIMEQLSRIQDKLATLKKHQKLNEASGEKDIELIVQGIKIGDCLIISSPLELLTEIGLRLKTMSPVPITMIAGYSNGYLHYGPPAGYYNKGGYEVTECLLAPEWQHIFEHKVKTIIEAITKKK